VKEIVVDASQVKEEWVEVPDKELTEDFILVIGDKRYSMEKNVVDTFPRVLLEGKYLMRKIPLSVLR
jgi:hypothetical protein